MLGRIQPDHFPHVFGPAGDQPLDAEVVREHFAALESRMGDGRTAEQVAAGFLEIAVANMANAIKKISVQRGYDVTRYVLATFGGAGGQHACAVADALGMRQVLIHPLAGVLSAYGMGLADVTAMRESAVERPLDADVLPELTTVLGKLEAEAELHNEGVTSDRIRLVRHAHLRYAGTDTALQVPAGTVFSMVREFEKRYQQRFSFLMTDRPVVVEAASIEAVGRAGDPVVSVSPRRRRRHGHAASARVPVYIGGSWTEVDLHHREDLRPGDAIKGPAIIAEANATTVVNPGWPAVVDDLADLVLTRVEAGPRRKKARRERIVHRPERRTGKGPLLRRLARSPRRDRRNHARFDAGLQHPDRAGGRPHRRLAPRGRRGGRRTRAPDSRFWETETVDLLRSASHPSRNPLDNIADLRAQIAANEKGVQELRAMVGYFGLDVVHAYMRHVRDNAEEAVRRVISVLRDGSCAYELGNGAVISVAVHVDRAARTAEIDFTGTSPQLKDNFNAPSSVAMAAVLYVFRTLVAEDIPLNAGCLTPIRVKIPPGTMLSPEYPAAVAAGTVETSQAVTGALYAALGVMAEGCGTMNNVTFGDDHQYYETVAGGSGAGDGFDGTSVVQTNMTNSRLTDPEVLEWRYPVRLETFEIRHGSGGAGHWRGGDGGRRRIRFLQPMTVTTLAGHRRVPPYGMAGGGPGGVGRQWVEHADGSVTTMRGCDSLPIDAGDVFVIETPGGGGYGHPDPP